MLNVDQCRCQLAEPLVELLGPPTELPELDPGLHRRVELVLAPVVALRSLRRGISFLEFLMRAARLLLYSRIAGQCLGGVLDQGSRSLHLAIAYAVERPTDVDVRRLLRPRYTRSYCLGLPNSLA